MSPRTPIVFAAAVLSAFVLLSSAPPAAAQGGADAAPKVTVLKASRMFDGVTGKLATPGLVVVTGDRITAVGGRAEVPAGAEVIDLGDSTLLPGFIDSHVHITGEMGPIWSQDFYDRMLRFPTEQAHFAAMYAERTLAAGFTTVRNVGDWSAWNDVGLRNAIGKGIAEGPRMLVAGHSIGSTGGHCDGPPFPPHVVDPFGPIEGVCDGPEECRKAMRYQMKWGADLIKICASGGVLSESDPVDVPQLTPGELAAIVSEAHAWGRKVAAHSHGDEAAKLAIEAGVDSIEHGTFLTTATLDRMKRKGVYLVPTRMANFWVGANADRYPPAVAAKARAANQAHDAMMRNALKLGVPIAFGTDSGVSPHGRNAEEFALLTAVGMTPAAALLSATREAATLLGILAETGTLEAGKAADVVALPGDPLADIRATERPVLVMRAGKVVVGPR